MFTIKSRFPRGIRNNNPGNIRRGNIVWEGMVPAYETIGEDADFVVFTTPEMGIRAMVRILITYRNRHNLTTIRQVITRWAPPNENDSAAYINHVAEMVGIGVDDQLDYAQHLRPLVEAIIDHENGGMPYQDRILVVGINRGLGLA